MVTIEEKIRLFSELVYQDIVKESDGKLQKIESQNKEKLEVAKKKYEAEVNKIFESQKKKTEHKKTQMMSFVNMQQKRKILSAKEVCIHRMMSRLTKKAVVFCQSDKYLKYLANTIETFVPVFEGEEQIHVCMVKEDLDRVKDFVVAEIKKQGFQEEQIVFEPADAGIIGGLVFENNDKIIRMDGSIQAKFDEKKEEIIHSVYEQLNEVGDDIG